MGPTKPLHLDLSKDGPYGWGVCSRHLRRLLPQRVHTLDLPRTDEPKRIHGTILHTISNHRFDTECPYEGDFDVGYTFFENVLRPECFNRARRFDLLLAGSTWCRDRLTEFGIRDSEILLQGIDTGLFRKLPPRKDDGKFVIFSGGKFEIRKGQDLVLEAFKRLQERYKDMHLVTCWANAWPEIADTMLQSPYIRYVPYDKERSWVGNMHVVYAQNRIRHNRVTTYPMLSNEAMPGIYAQTDIGLFPNRCEGGTNLVMMEYMACGRPVIASNLTGHKDVLTEKNSLRLGYYQPFILADSNGMKISDWEEPIVDEIVDAVEYAYHHRDEMLNIGKRAALDMRYKFTWEASADRLVDIVYGGGREERNNHSGMSLQIASREDFPNLFNDLNLTGHGLELGVQKGEFSEILRKKWKGKFLHLVDRWRNSSDYFDIANVSDDKHRLYYLYVVEHFSEDPSVIIHRMDSETASLHFQDRYLDWIYIDADHSYEAVKKDLHLWVPKVCPGGIVAGHDFLDGKNEFGEFGVKRAVEEYAESRGIRIYVTQEPEWRSWYFVKT
jgi:glycosyltransferase involved in cell wall biosynthesis